jgi:hypothetical protein
MKLTNDTNKALCLARGHKTCRFQWVFERKVPPCGLVAVDTDAAPQSGTFHTANRCVAFVKTTNH